MEKILFVNKYATFIKESLIQKFNGQMDALISLGYEVWYVEWDGSYTWLVNRNQGIRHKITSTKTKNKESFYHTFYFPRLYKDIKKIVKNKKFDYVYMRKMPLFPSALAMGKEIRKQDAKLVFEIPTYSYIDEWKKITSLLRRVFLRFSESLEKMFNKYISLYTIMGRDEEGEFRGKPALNIKNGINVKAIKKKEISNSEEIHLIAVASMCYWHGYDRVINGLALYEGDRKVILHMVGPDGDGSLSEWKTLVNKLEIEKKVVFHGKVYGNELDQLFDKCNVAISTLGLYRQNTNSSGVLKSREYMARGIPFVYAGVDVSFDSDFLYAKKVANDNSNINIEEIISFFDKVRNDDYSQIMRQYAEDNMSWENEFIKVMSFFKKK